MRLQRKLRRLRTPYPSHFKLEISQDVKTVFTRTFSRPPRMMLNPVCMVLVVYYSYLYSIIFIFLVSIPLLFGRPEPPTNLFSYKWKETTEGLAYLGLLLGFLLAALSAALAQDRIYAFLSKRDGDGGRPEYRLILTQIGMVFLPVGLLIWAWTAQTHAFFFFPLMGTFILGFGLMLGFNSVQNFLVDNFAPYSAAAMAVATLFRSIVGSILPIFAPVLFENLGWGVGGTALAAIASLVIPAPMVIYRWGPGWREKWKFEG